jgi:HEAT repeat protein
VRKRVLAAISLLISIAGLIVWILLPKQNALFYGKPESEWIKSITYYGDEAQLKQWRAFGPDGLRLLALALDKGRSYRKTYRWVMPRLPGILSARLYRRLPKPEDSHSTRMCVISLLKQFGKDAKPVEPAIARALRDDDSGVRQIAIGCYEELLGAMTDREKLARLPDFIRAMQDSDWGIRNNAVVALRFYADQLTMVVPVLIKALQDPEIHVRMLAAEALAHIDLSAAIHSGAVPIAIQILRDPNDQVAYQAAELLGTMGQEPDLAVPALVEAMHGTNALVATMAARALGKFPAKADVIVPVLVKAFQETNSIISRWALTAALKEIDPTNAPEPGVKQTK